MISNNGTSKEGIRILSPAMLKTATSVQSMENTVRNLTPNPLAPSSKWGLGVGIDTGISLSSQSQRSVYWGGFFNTAYSVDFECGFASHGGTNILNFYDVGSKFNVEVENFDTRVLNLNYAARNCVKVNYQNANGNSPVTSTSP